MAYQLFIIEQDTGNYVELDTEDVDFTTIFSIGDIEDISKRKDKITKTINLKGSKTNNQAFGSLFHQNMVSEFSLDNKILFNYNPLRTVDCLIYEDGALLLRGTLRLYKIKSDANENITYTTVATGSFIDFKTIVTEKNLSDLDFRDLKHRYNYSVIKDSWEIRTERYNTTTSATTYNAFEKGSGYVYPMMEMGITYKQPNSESNVDTNNFPVLNFRPAVYVREYCNKIFSQPELSGYTYEVKGDANFIDRFDSMIVPSNDEILKNSLTGFNLKFEKATITIENQSSLHTFVPNAFSQYFKYRLLHFDSFPVPPANTVSPFLAKYANENGILNVLRTFKSDAQVSVNFTNIFNGTAHPVKFHIGLVERDFSTNPSPIAGWTTLYEQTFTYNAGTGSGGQKFITLNIPERTWEQNKQVGLLLCVENLFQSVLFSNLTPVTYNIFTHSISFPKDNSTPFEVLLGVDENNVVVPTPPANIKQGDFLKSIIAMNNLYVYTEKKDPKHLIFEQYNDFYALTSPVLLPTTALDWTQKVDYSQGFENKSNIDLPKKYSFVMKDDTDFINSEYKRSWGESYGTYKFNDAYGLVDEKKIEVIFSPTPLIKTAGSNRVYPAIYSVDGVSKKPFKSNIRLMYYNGVKQAIPAYTISKDVLSGGAYSVAPLESGLIVYPNAGNYFLASGVTNTTPLHDMYFGVPKSVYFNATAAHFNAPTAYQDYYRNQISDLTNPNVSIIECQVWLNELDIANLELKIPIFIDFGETGHGYYRPIEIEYTSNTTLARCILQKIVI